MGTTETASEDVVVIIHGLGSNRFVMEPLAARLRGNFPRVINWGYNSLWSSIEHHAAGFETLLRRLDSDARTANLHVVTHSMGGIVTRTVLQQYRPAKLGRIVMVAPPNQGSQVARRLAPMLGRICPPLRQLSCTDGSFVTRLPQPAGVSIGVIAAQGDFMVHLESTHLQEEADHVVLPGQHSGICWRHETAVQITHFLRHGKFERGE